MDLTQRPELRQKVSLSPQVYQGLSILAMPIVELEQLIEQELLENPVLEVEEQEYDDETEPADTESSSEEADDRSWDDWLDSYEDIEASESFSPRDPGEESTNAEEFVSGIQTFDDYLIEQLNLLDVEDGVHRAAVAIIGTLDDDGFFVGDCHEIGKVAGVSCETAEKALGVVQQLDPPGVGARDLAEAMCLEMEYLGINEPLLVRMVKEHLDDIGNNHYRKVARALKVSEDEVRRLVDILRQLNPRPAGAFSPGRSPGYVVPDVTVRNIADEWLIFSNGESVPSLRVSSRYRAMLRSGSSADEETRKYLKDRVRSAESFIKNIDRRKDTVSRITKIILDVQQEFFQDGKGPLRPLRLEDVAIELGVHLSTVSRGVTGKYMATPYGLFELKHFFSGGYRTSTGFDVASTTIKQRLRDLIKEEDRAHPLSDQHIAELLTEEGVHVARRTVAKYREELGVEPSWARRRR